MERLGRVSPVHLGTAQKPHHADEAIAEYHKKHPFDLSLLQFVEIPSLLVKGHTYNVPAMPMGIYVLDAWTSNFVD
jgi:hypothetical protein